MTTERPSLDPVLEAPTSVDDLPAIIVGWMGMDASSSFARSLPAKVPTVLGPLTDQMQEGDELWTCRSAYIGPLAGNRGVALVRNGVIVQYMPIMHY
jgi:hypothetical protein